MIPTWPGFEMKHTCRSISGVFAASILVGWSPSVLAGAPGVGGTISSDAPITAPWFEPEITTVPDPSTVPFHEPGVLFINFDGGQMQNCNGSNYAPNNCSTIMNDVVLPYSGSGSARAAVVQTMAADVSDFAVSVVDVRPAEDVDYDMVMVGDWDPPPDEGGFAGVAPTIDCWNTNRSETAFSLDLGSPSTVAKVVGQEAAHVWGLEHVDSPGDVLFPTTGGAADPSFEDACHQIVVLDGGIQPTEAVCADMHAVNCPDQPDHQNSYQDMMMVFGPPEPDMVGPLLEILSPMQDEEFPSGGDIEVRLRMEDNISPPLFEVYVSLDADEQGPQLGPKDYLGPELSFGLNALADGPHFLRIDLADQDGNLATASVDFHVGPETMPGDTGSPGDTTAGSADETGAGSNGDGLTDTGTGGGTTGDDDGGASQDDEQGCGCAASPVDARTPAGLALLLLLARSRRRRRQAGS